MNASMVDDDEIEFENGREHYLNKNYRMSLKVFKALAKKGNIKAQYYMGLTYEYGDGVFKSNKTAFKWYLMSAENGYGPAQSALYDIYKEGKGIKSNVERALHWCRRAADQELRDAQYNMGVNYMEGYGVEQNYKVAMEWYNRAAERNCLEAQYAIAYMILKGMGVEINHKQAYFWIIIARNNSPCHFSDNDAFLNYCFSDTTSETDRFVYQMIERALKMIPSPVIHDVKIIEQANEWIKQHASTNSVDYNKVLKSLVKRTIPSR